MSEPKAWPPSSAKLCPDVACPAALYDHTVNSEANSPPQSDWPVNILAAMMFLIPAVGVPNEYMLQDTLKSAIAAFGILLAALAWTWDMQKNPRPLKWHWIVFLPLALCIYALGSMVWSHTYLAGVEAVRWFLASLLMWLVLNTMHMQNLSRLLWGIHWGVFVASVWVGLQFWFDLKLFPQAAPPASTFVNRNFFAEYASSVLPLSVYLLLAQPYSRWLGLVTLTLALDVVAILMTGTRSALLALAITTPLMLLAVARYRYVLGFASWASIQRIYIAAIFLAAVAILGSIPSGNADMGIHRTPFTVGSTRSVSITGVLQGKDEAFSARLEMWKSTARMVMATPWTGVGAGAWEVHIPLYQPKSTALEIDYYAHNDHIQMLSEYGAIVGGLALAALIAHMLLSTASIVRRTPHPGGTDDALRGIAAISLLALLLVANAGFPLHLASGGSLLALTLAFTTRHTNGGADGRFLRMPWRAVYRPYLLVALSVGLVLATVVTQRAVVGEYKLVRAIETYADIRRVARNPGADIEKLHHSMVEDIHQAIAIVPHYRKLITESGDNLVALGDWENVVPAWEVVARSRPNIPAVWTILAIAYARTHQHALASTALSHVQHLRPDDIGTTTLAIQLKKEAGDLQTAKQMLSDQLRRGHFSYDMLQLAYVVGYQTNEPSLAIQAMELRNIGWPAEAADGHMRLGKLYADPRLNDNKEALAQFALGLQLVPVNDRLNFLAQVPERFRLLLLRDNWRDKGSNNTLGAGNHARGRSAGN